MSDEDKREQDRINPDEELDLEIELDGTEDADTILEKLKEERQVRVKERDAWRVDRKAKSELTARSRKAEEENKALRKSSTISKSEESPRGDIDEDVLDLRFEGYSKEDVIFIQANGGRKALEDKNSLVYLAIKTKREQQKAEEEASKTADTSQMTDIERKYTAEQLEKMPLDKLEQILPRAPQQ